MNAMISKSKRSEADKMFVEMLNKNFKGDISFGGMAKLSKKTTRQLKKYYSNQSAQHLSHSNS